MAHLATGSTRRSCATSCRWPTTRSTPRSPRPTRRGRVVRRADQVAGAATALSTPHRPDLGAQDEAAFDAVSTRSTPWPSLSTRHCRREALPQGRAVGPAQPAARVDPDPDPRWRTMTEAAPSTWTRSGRGSGPDRAVLVLLTARLRWSRRSWMRTVSSAGSVPCARDDRGVDRVRREPAQARPDEFLADLSQESGVDCPTWWRRTS